MTAKGKASERNVLHQTFSQPWVPPWTSEIDACVRSGSLFQSSLGSRCCSDLKTGPVLFWKKIVHEEKEDNARSWYGSLKHSQKAWEHYCAVWFTARDSRPIFRSQKGALNSHKHSHFCSLRTVYHAKMNKDSWDHSESKHKHCKLSIKKTQLCLSEYIVYRVLSFSSLPTGLLGKRCLLSLKANHLQSKYWRPWLQGRDGKQTIFLFSSLRIS